MKRKNLNREEHKEVEDVVTKIVNSKQALNLKCVPEDLSFDEYRNYFLSAIGNFSVALFIYEDWKRKQLIENNATRLIVLEDCLLFRNDYEESVND